MTKRKPPKSRRSRWIVPNIGARQPNQPILPISQPGWHPESSCVVTRPLEGRKREPPIGFVTCFLIFSWIIIYIYIYIYIYRYKYKYNICKYTYIHIYNTYIYIWWYLVILRLRSEWRRPDLGGALLLDGLTKVQRDTTGPLQRDKVMNIY